MASGPMAWRQRGHGIAVTRGSGGVSTSCPAAAVTSWGVGEGWASGPGTAVRFSGMVGSTSLVSRWPQDGQVNPPWTSSPPHRLQFKGLPLRQVFAGEAGAVAVLGRKKLLTTERPLTGLVSPRRTTTPGPRPRPGPIRRTLAGRSPVLGRCPGPPASAPGSPSASRR